MEAQSHPEQLGSLELQTLLNEAFRKAYVEAPELVPSGIRACALATLELSRDPAAVAGIEELLAHKVAKAQFPDTLGQSYLFNGWVRAHQEQMYDTKGYANEYTYRSPRGQSRAVVKWRESMAAHLFDDQSFERLKYVYSELPTMSNISDRYKAFAVQLQLMKERYKGPLKVLDVGGSLGQGLEKLKLNDEQKTLFRPTEVIRRPAEYNPAVPDRNIDPKAAEIDLMESQRFTRLQNRRSNVAIGVSVDMLDIHDALVRRKAISDSRYPDEWNDPVYNAQFQEIEQFEPIDGIEFVQANFADPEQMADALPLKEYGGWFDAAFICLSLYQSSEEAREVVLTNVDKRLHDDAFYSVTDFAGKVANHPDRLEFYKNWVSYSLSTFMWDKRNPGEWQQLFDSENGRFTRICYGLGTLAVNGVHRSVEEMVEAAL